MSLHEIARRIAKLIEDKLGVKYHHNHVGKLLHQIGWSRQKPERCGHRGMETIHLASWWGLLKNIWNARSKSKTFAQQDLPSINPTSGYPAAFMYYTFKCRVPNTTWGVSEPSFLATDFPPVSLIGAFKGKGIMVAFYDSFTLSSNRGIHYAMPTGMEYARLLHCVEQFVHRWLVTKMCYFKVSAHRFYRQEGLRWARPTV